MKYILLLVITLGLSAAKPEKIDVQKHINKPLFRFINKYEQHIFCMVVSKNGETKSFYLAPKSTSRPMLFQPGFKWWCKLPDKDV